MSVVSTSATPPPYPAKLSVDYPDRKLNRLTSFFRIFTVIPIAIVLGSIGAGALNKDWASWIGPIAWTPLMLFFPLLLMILFRQKYPRWWFDFNLALARVAYRVEAYIALLRDEYPSTDEEQAVHLDLVYPDVQKDLMRGMPIVKWFLAIPHYIVLFFMLIAAVVCVIIAWFAILFTGRLPRGLFDFIVGVGRWILRVHAYAFLLITDKYPPFSIEP